MVRLKEELKGDLTKKEIELVPSSFDVVGDILIFIEFPKELEKKEKIIGKKILEIYKNIKVVTKKIKKYSGKYRVPKLKILAGEKRFETEHKENNTRIKLNVEKVYFFSSAPTIADVLEKAGIYYGEESWDKERDNGSLSSGTAVVLESSKEGLGLALRPMDAAKLWAFGIPFNINTVSAEDLTYIPGVGPELAANIIAYRNESGAFNDVEELRRVKGIGEKRLQRMRAYVAVR